MVTAQQNERWTRVKRGTPAGEMLRRYWWPIGFSELVTNKPVPARLLGEDLILFRDGAAKVGCSTGAVRIAAPPWSLAGSRPTVSAAASTAGSSPPTRGEDE